jgi:hypothetical protein
VVEQGDGSSDSLPRHRWSNWGKCRAVVKVMVMMCKIQLERLLSSNSQGPAGPALADMHGDHQLKLCSRGGGGPGRHSNTLEEGLTGHRFDNFPLESHVVTFAPASTVHHRFNGSQPIKHKVSVFYLGKQSSRPAPTDGLPPRRVPMGLARAGLARRLADLGGACPHQLSSTAAPP